MQESRWIIDKTEVASRDGLVVTKDVLASRAGVAMLQAGGNAVDAAVAAAFAIAVVEPWMNSIGGGGFMLIHLAREGRTVALDYAMRGPLAGHEHLFRLDEGVSAELFGWRKVKDDANIHGWQSIAVPGVVAGLCRALAEYGTLPLAQVLAPAISLARGGFPVTWHTQLAISADAQVLSRYPETARTFFTNGMPKVIPRAGQEWVRQPELAATLAQIAAEGPDVFYQGAIAARIAAEMRAHGGLITEEDLAAYQVQIWDPAPAVDFGAFRVYAPPCPSGGTSLQEVIGILAGTGLERCSHGSPEALHLIAEASRLAWADRFRYLCDPGWMEFPWQNLLRPDYTAARRALMNRERALPEALPGRPGDLAPGRAERPGGPDGSTTALVAADRDQNMVAITQTLMMGFGSRITIPGTGILMNDGMYWFDPEPGKANSVGPGKKPLNNMAPLIVTRAGRPFLAISSSGGRNIPDANLHLFLNAAVFGLGMQAAVSSPRIDLSAGYIIADDRIDGAVLENLRQRGHRVDALPESFRPRRFASPTCLRVDPETGLLTSGADPFHPAAALGI